MREDRGLNLASVVPAVLVFILLLLWFGRDKDFEPLIGIIAGSELVLTWAAYQWKRLRYAVIVPAILIFSAGLYFITQLSVFLIAAIALVALAVIGAVAYIIYRYYNDTQKYEKALHLIKKSHQSWYEGKYHWRFLMEYEDLLFVNKLKDRIAMTPNRVTSDELAYILRCALQHGFRGEWGYWAAKNSDNENIRAILVDAISVGHFRPKWRAAFVLEKTPVSERERLYNNLSQKDRGSADVQEVFEVLASGGVKEHLQKAFSQKKNQHLQGKVLEILDEVNIFASNLDQYRRERDRYNKNR